MFAFPIHEDQADANTDGPAKRPSENFRLKPEATNVRVAPIIDASKRSESNVSERKWYVDEYRIYLHLVVVGHGNPYFAGRSGCP